MLPKVVLHLDWGVQPHKRWLARALLKDGCYEAFSPSMVEDTQGFTEEIRDARTRRPPLLVGFDFPIGIPQFYAERVGVQDFKRWLLGLGRDMWADFFSAAGKPDEISLHRPFYPAKPGGTRQAHLVSALGAASIEDLRRTCERRQEARRAACPLFWTLGAQQVGKGALAGWREVIIPLLDDSTGLWPFDGPFDRLLNAAPLIIVETYPAEYYRWFFPVLLGKTESRNRKKVAGALLEWAYKARVELESRLRASIEEGFPEGDDAFDAVVGLFGMLAVVIGQRPPGDTNDERIARIEGWILGQSSLG